MGLLNEFVTVLVSFRKLRFELSENIHKGQYFSNSSGDPMLTTVTHAALPKEKLIECRRTFFAFAVEQQMKFFSPKFQLRNFIYTFYDWKVARRSWRMGSVGDPKQLKIFASLSIVNESLRRDVSLFWWVGWLRNSIVRRLDWQKIWNSAFGAAIGSKKCLQFIFSPSIDLNFASSAQTKKTFPSLNF